MAWNHRHAEILRSYFNELDKANIKFFIIRNFEGLPEYNSSKDVDIILKHGTAFDAEEILKKIFKKYGLKYYYRVRIEESLLCRAISDSGDFAIHIDLMNGYINRGVELFSFEELYLQTVEYNGFRVLNELYNGIMLFIYKQFGYKRPYLKKEYQETIYRIWKKYPDFSAILGNMLGVEFMELISQCIREKDFHKMLSYSYAVTSRLRKYSRKHNFLRDSFRRLFFLFQKVNRVVICYRKYEKSISVMAPDGAGKTTFLQSLLEKLAFIYVDRPKDLSRFHIYHFRPSLLPNLGEVGEKAKLMVQDKDFTNPHRAKPVGFLSSLFRITYYWLDYAFGWMYFTRRDVQYDIFTVYDRYSYDLLIDPFRTRLKLPYWLRNVFVTCMPHPKLNFFLKADPNVILKRKHELAYEEISRQIIEYEKLAQKKNVIILDANQDVEKIVDDGIKYVISKFWIEL